MRPVAVGLAAALALLTVLAVIATGGAAAAGSRTIQVTSVTLSVVSHDVKPKGPSKGDTVVYRDRLVNRVAQFGKSKGSVVGSDGGTLTFTGPNSVTIEGHTTLPGGTVTLGGAVTGLANGGLIIHVVSGTGAYAHMRGTLTVGPGKDRVLNTYRLVRSSALVA